jgi:hypothetical protein
MIYQEEMRIEVKHNISIGKLNPICPVDIETSGTKEREFVFMQMRMSLRLRCFFSWLQKENCYKLSKDLICII